MLDIYFSASDAALRAVSQIAALKYVNCQNMHVDTTLTTIASKIVHKCSVCGNTRYKSQVLSGNPLKLLC